MLNKFLNFARGRTYFTLNANDSRKAVMAFYEKNMKVTREGDRLNKVFFSCRSKDAKNVESVLLHLGIEILKINENGILPFVKRYRKRPGMILGILFLLVSLVISRLFIWQINVEGNETYSKEETLRLLEDHGVFVGAFTPSLDLHSIYNDILIDNDALCWISINIRGTVANVQVRESEFPQKMTPPKGKYANIVAAYDGEIVSVESYGGQNVVKIGDPIRAGELLVSGFYEDKMGRTVLSYARGSVYAKIQRTFKIEVPLSYEKKIYTGERQQDLSIKIFSKTINILNNSRNINNKYDIIVDNEEICLFDRVYLPISYCITTYSSYDVLNVTRDEEKAKLIAHRTLNREMLEFAGDGEILSKDIEEGVHDGVYSLNVTATMITDIAKTQEFVYNEG